MLSPAERIVEATLPHTLRPKSGDREKVIVSVLEFIIEEFGYIDLNYQEVIDVKDLRNLIEELKDTVTVEEPPYGHTRTDLEDT
jgi:hypothetical protein